MKKFTIKLWAVLLLMLVSLQTFATDNEYGLKDNIQDGVILHCFDWTYEQIKEELPNIAAAGFSAVQTSPAHPREPVGAPWYMLYQPYDYKVGENGLGTKEGLTELCTEAHQYGVKIIVDVVANHTNGNLSYVASFWQDQSLYHDYQGGIDYSKRWQVTHGRLGMWDLKTEDSRVQEKIKEYVAELKSCGVDGIRWDAAKHIGLPSEGDTFWQNVPDQTMYNYGEILDGTSGDDTVLFPEYQKYISITDNQYGNHFAASFNSGQVNESIGNFNQRKAATNKLVYWGESHDTYCNDGGESKYISQNNIDRAYAVVAGNNGATALYFSRPFEKAKSSIKVGVKGSTHFKDREVAAVNHLHNICAGEPNYYVHENGVAAQCRKSGAVIVLGSGGNREVSVTNGDGKGNWVKAGTYTDQVSGNTFTVTASKISGKVGAKGIAVIYEGEPLPPTPPAPSNLPTCATWQEGKTFCYFENSSSWAGPIYAWVWNSVKKLYAAGWPGSMEHISKVGTHNGNDVYLWSIDKGVFEPTGIIFNSNKSPQTTDLDFENGAYYNASSEKVEVVSQTTGVQLHPVAGESSAKAMIYNLQGQRVDANYHGVVVCNGRKYVQ